MYLWRKSNPTERTEILATRHFLKRPWHSPPHLHSEGQNFFHLTATCFEHAPVIGRNLERLDAFPQSLQGALETACKQVFAWCVLPNHYHLLVETWNLRETTSLLGQFHGRTSRVWNLEEGTRGRHCFHRTADREIRGDRHFWATVNYIPHNPVHHGLVEKWGEWPWSSAPAFLEKVGRQEAIRLWNEYPILDYGKKWDAAENPNSEGAPFIPPKGGTTYEGGAPG
jgi:putative transposase